MGDEEYLDKIQHAVLEGGWDGYPVLRREVEEYVSPYPKNPSRMTDHERSFFFLDAEPSDRCFTESVHLDWAWRVWRRVSPPRESFEFWFRDLPDSASFDDRGEPEFLINGYEPESEKERLAREEREDRETRRIITQREEENTQREEMKRLAAAAREREEDRRSQSEFRAEFYRSLQGRRTLFGGEFKVELDEWESRLPDEARFLDGRTPLFDYDPRMHLDRRWDHF